MTLSPSLVIRIVPDNGSAVDWTVHPGITFRDVLVCILKMLLMVYSDLCFSVYYSVKQPFFLIYKENVFG